MKYILGVLAVCGAFVMADTIKLSDVKGSYSKYKAVKADKELKQALDLGFASTSGNTDTLNLNAKYALSATRPGYDGKALRFALDGSLFISENDNIRDNEEYKFNMGAEQFIAEEWLTYVSLNWLQNEFQNYDTKFAVGLGLGKEIFNFGEHSLVAKVGLAYNIEEYSNDQEGVDFTSLNEYLEYNVKFNEVSSLYVKFGAYQNVEDFSDYDLLFVAGFRFAVAENLSVSLEQEVKYDKIPPIGFDTTDTKSIVLVGYHF